MLSAAFWREKSVSFFRSDFEVVNDLETIQNRPPQKDFDLIFIFVKNSQIQKTLGSWRKMHFFFRVQIQLLSAAFTQGIRIAPLGIRIARPFFTFSLLRKLSGIQIRIATSKIQIASSEIRISWPKFTFSLPETHSGIWIRIASSGIRIAGQNSLLHLQKHFLELGFESNFRNSNLPLEC